MATFRSERFMKQLSFDSAMFRNRNIFDTHGSSSVFWVANENYVIIHVYLEVYGFFWPFGFPPVLCLDKTCVSHLLSDPESRV